MKVIADYVNFIIRDSKESRYLAESYIVNLYKGKGDLLWRGNYWSLKLLEHDMKVLEQVLENPSKDWWYAVWVHARTWYYWCYIHLKAIAGKILCKEQKYAFHFRWSKDLDQVLWWAMRRLGVDKWIIQFVQAMYYNASSKVHIENCFRDSFCLNVGMHLDSVLYPLLFIMVLQALSQEFRTQCTWELLYSAVLLNQLKNFATS